MREPKPGEIVTDGKSVNIGAPSIRANGDIPSMLPSEVLGNLIRHMKGGIAALEQLRALLEERERQDKERLG